MSVQAQLCEAVCAALEADETLSAAGDVVVFCENRVDPNVQVKQHATTKLRVMIATTGHARSADAGPSTHGDTALEITVFEDPVRRRSRPDALTVTSAAERIVDVLHYAALASTRLRYVDMARADANEHEYRMVITFAAEQAPGGETIYWGLADGTQAYGEITRKRTIRGGTPLFEPGRDGNARYTGTADAHLEVDLEANVTSPSASFPTIGGTFTCPATGVNTTFICTLSELSESTESGKTIHLAGRTIGQ